MRRTVTLGAAILMTCALAACSSGGSRAVDSASSSTAAGLSLEDVHDKLIAAGINCDGNVDPYEATANELNLGATAIKAFECTSGGPTIKGTAFGSVVDRRAAELAAESFACSFGSRPPAYVHGDTWTISTSTTDGQQSDDALTKKVAAALGLTVEQPGCSTDTGSPTTTAAPTKLIPEYQARLNASKDANLGDEIDKGDGVSLKVLSVKAAASDRQGGAPHFEASVQVDNNGTRDSRFLGIGVVCAGSIDTGTASWNSSATDLDGVKPGASAQGQIALDLPPSPGESTRTTPCSSPAVLRIQIDAPKDVDIAIPAGVLDDLNRLLPKPTN